MLELSCVGEPQIVAVPRAENAEAVKAVEAWIETVSVPPGEVNSAAHHKRRRDGMFVKSLSAVGTGQSFSGGVPILKMS